MKAVSAWNFSVHIGEEAGLWTNLNSAGYLQQASTAWQTKIIGFDAW